MPEKPTTAQQLLAAICQQLTSKADLGMVSIIVSMMGLHETEQFLIQTGREMGCEFSVIRDSVFELRDRACCNTCAMLQKAAAF